mgnify:FL=1|tara:strand:- start:190 stop:510 length:321 start_codon:yes stop_codon:yes gene_type:complete
MMSQYEKDLNEREEANQRFALGNDGYRLFKAAPELLEVLEEVAVLIEEYSLDHNSDRPTDVTIVLPRVLAAIAKAKGQEVQELDEDGIPLPGPLPFPNEWPPKGEE